MTIRIAATEVSHWHAVYDAAYLRHLIAMPDVELVAIQDSDADVAAKRATEVRNPSIFTDYSKMLAATHPDFAGGIDKWLGLGTTCSIRVIHSRWALTQRR